ncbi:MAG: hypothetical protein AB8B92_04515 [Gammaproteobacteria bacterium]
MLSNKSIQRLYKPFRLQKLPVVKKLFSLNSNQTSSEDAANDTNLSRDQVIEIYDWIAQIKSQSNDA